MAAKKKTTKKMKTLQAPAKISFEQLVLLVMNLPAKKKRELNELVWGNGYGISDEDMRIVNERREKYRKHPEKMLKWADVRKKLK